MLYLLTWESLWNWNMYKSLSNVFCNKNSFS
jgi:hypothetical protein